MVVAVYLALLGLCIAVALQVMRRREWDTVGLYVAFGYLFGSMAKHEIWIQILFDPNYDPSQYIFIAWPASSTSLILTAMIGLLEFYAMVGALRCPRFWPTVALFPIAIYQLTMTTFGLTAFLSEGLPVTMSVAGADVPVWLGLFIYLVVFDIPFVCAIPWGYARLHPRQASAAGKIRDRIVFNTGLALVTLTIIAFAFFGASLRIAQLSGYGSIIPALFFGMAMFVLVGIVVATMLDFNRTLLSPAFTILENIERGESLANSAAIGPIWAQFASQIDLSRRELEETRAQLAGFFDNVPVAMTLGGLDGRIIMANRAVAEAYGRDVDHLPSMDPAEIARFWPESVALVGALMQVHATGQPQRLTTPFRASEDAPDLIYDVVVFPIRSSDGAIIQIGSLGIDITTQHKLLAELETKNSSMQAFFDNAPMLMFASDLDDRVTSISNWAQEKTGPDESNPQIAIGMKVSESRWLAWTEFAESSYQAAIERGVSSTANIQLNYAGLPRETLSVRFPIRDQTGQIVQIGGYILDITDQKKAEEALAEREAMLAGIFDHAPVAITVFSRERRMVAANRAATAAYGMSRVGKRSLPVERFRPFWPEFDRFVELGLSVFETGQPQQFNIAFNPPRGGEQEIKEAIFFPICSSTGEVVQVGLFMLDVTEQVRAQEESARSRATLQAFFENIPAMTFIIAPDRRYVTSNSYAVEHYGFDFLSPENLIGKPDITGTPEAWHPVIEEAHRKVMEEGKTHTAEPSFELPDGSLHLLVSRFPIRNAEGEITHVGGLIFDRTAEKRASEAVVAARESLHQSEKLAALGQLLAGVAHELNNPLTVVVGRSAILEEKLRDTPHGKAIADLREAADRCNRIVRTFLAMARQSAPRRAAVQINDAIEAALDMTTYGLRSSGIELIRNFDLALPEVEADEDQLVQVFTNLLINARHALEEHRPEGGKVTIATMARDGKLLVEIADNGAGVPHEIVSRIFEPFFTTKAVGDGTGMGLAMSKGMIEEHGGRLLYRDARGGGAVFTVELPLAGKLASAAPESEQEQIQSKVRGRVLVIDDEPSIRGLLVEILEGIELDCSQCGDGATALELLGKEQFDLVFCDVRMPVMDGVRFRQNLAEIAPAMLDRLVFISGDVLQRGRSRRAEIAQHPFIEKPFNPAEVRRLALSLLGGEGEMT